MYNILKIAIIGSSYSGKSCLCSAIANREVKKTYHHTIGIDFVSKYIARTNMPMLKLNILDGSGDQKFSVIVFSYIQNCPLLLFCYDSECVQSFNGMVELYKLYEKNNYIKGKFIIIIETKMDSVNSNPICHELGNTFSNIYNYPFIQVSAYNHKGISEIIDMCYSFACKTMNIKKKVEIKPRVEVKPTLKKTLLYNCTIV